MQSETFVHSDVQEYSKIAKNIIFVPIAPEILNFNDRSQFVQEARQRNKTGEKWAESNNIYRYIIIEQQIV